MPDVLTLHDGRVLVISEDAVLLYENMEAPETGEPFEGNAIYF